MGRWKCGNCLRMIACNKRKYVSEGDSICAKCQCALRNSSGSIHRKLRMSIAASQPVLPVCPATRSKDASAFPSVSSVSGSTKSATTHSTEAMDAESSQHSSISNDSLPSEDNSDWSHISSSYAVNSNEGSVDLSQSTCTTSDVTSTLIHKVNVSGMKSAVKSQRRCFICKSASGRTTIGAAAIKNVYARKRIRIPKNNRCCTSHLEHGLLTQEALDMVEPLNEDSQMDEEEVSEWISALTKLTTGPRVDFDHNSDLSDADYELLTGFPKEVFDDIVSQCQPLRSSCNRSKRNAVGMLMMQLRMNLTQKQLAFFFRVPNISTISETLEAVLEALEKTFVPKHIGFHHISRNDLIAKHSVPSYNKLLRTTAPTDDSDDEDDTYMGDDVLKLIFDCTYLYHQKPSDFELQRKTFCMHKGANLVKPMMVVTETGYILEASNVYFSDAANNDAAILQHMMDTGPLLDFFQVGDRAIFDRGFRDVVDFTEGQAIYPHMPPLLPRGAKQFSDLEANTSRQVTMIRWVVESANGRVKKKFSFFSDVIEASYLPKIGRLFRLACAFINAYSGPLFKESDEHEEIVDDAIARMHEENALLKMLMSENLLRKRTGWTEVGDSAVPEFPKLTMRDLKMLTLGVYQIKLAKLYTNQHMANSADFMVWKHETKTNLLKAKIQSRFTKNRKYNTWIEFEPNGVGTSSVTGYYCCCWTGARTLGTCSHVATMLYYLGYRRHQTEKTQKRRDLSSSILTAARTANEEASDSTNAQDE